MMRRTFFTALVAICCLYSGIANNLEISNITYNSNIVKFDISWENSWRGPGANPSFHDAVWIFIKVAPNGGETWNHVFIDVVDEGTFEVVTPSDLKGAFVRRATQGSGAVSGTLAFEVTGDLGLFQDIKVFGIEMVHIPLGSYSLGDGVSTNRFHQGDDDTVPYVVTDSDVMTYGTTANDIFSSSMALTVDVPADYPNGYNAFYCMKYEVSQIQYAEFLNCLSLAQQNTRTETDLSSGSWSNHYIMTNTNSVLERNSIKCIPPVNGDPLFFFCDLDDDDVPNEANDGQNLAMNHMSWDDLQAYLDWAALRPMSVFEFEKICRGPVTPVANEYAWGTAGITAPGNIINPGEDDETFDNIGATGVYGNPFADKLARCGFAATGTSDRLTSGATYYGVMEMTGNAVERTVVAQNVTLQFKENEYGDGELNLDGSSDIFNSSFTSRGSFQSAISFLNTTVGTVGSTRSTSSGGRGVR